MNLGPCARQQVCFTKCTPPSTQFLILKRAASLFPCLQEVKCSCVLCSVPRPSGSVLQCSLQTSMRSALLVSLVPARLGADRSLLSDTQSCFCLTTVCVLLGHAGRWESCRDILSIHPLRKRYSEMPRWVAIGPGGQGKLSQGLRVTKDCIQATQPLKVGSRRHGPSTCPGSQGEGPCPTPSGRGLGVRPWSTDTGVCTPPGLYNTLHRKPGASGIPPGAL